MKPLAYFDESGTSGSAPAVIVGGYVAGEEVWDRFLKQWEDFSAKEGIDRFRASELLSGFGGFKDEEEWPWPRRLKVMEIFDEIVLSNPLFGFVSYVEIQECEKVFPLRDPNSNVRLRSKYEAEYLFAAAQLVSGIGKWSKENGLDKKITFVFEDGAPGKKALRKATQYIARNREWCESHLFGGISFESKEGAPQTMAADKLVHLFNSVLGRSLTGDRITGRDEKRLQKASVYKVYRFDKENLPLIPDFGFAKRSN